ncbi:MAG: hypothetical protein KDD47_03270, partial [Acidobacteria bacterium]|nr:hypothetical protein [Acidobacteriota bacterium]
LAHRLQVHGERSLTDAELLALIGGLDTQHALDLLQGTGGLARLRINIDTALPDTSLAAARLMASLEFSKRMLRAKLPTGKLLDRPPAVAKYLLARYSLPGQEVFGALYLDHQHRLIEDREVFRGTRTRCNASPEPFLRRALLIGAGGLIAWHTHPGDEVKPSREDVAFTGRLLEACEAVGVMLVDHLILGGTKEWSSMRQQGMLTP